MFVTTKNVSKLCAAAFGQTLHAFTIEICQELEQRGVSSLLTFLALKITNLW